MAKDEKRGGAKGTPNDGATGDAKSGSAAPYRESGSGPSYDPDANWGAERELNGPAGGDDSMAGGSSGAGDGGFGPEGDFSGSGGRGAANVLGGVNGDDSALIKEAQSRGPRKADRRFTGGEGVDEPDSMG